MLKKIRSLSRGGTLPTDNDVTRADGPVTCEGKLTLPGPVALQSTEYWCRLIGDKLFYYKNSQVLCRGVFILLLLSNAKATKR